MKALEAVRASYRRIRKSDEPRVWIYLIPEDHSIERAKSIADDLPLAGLTFALKDNIDLAGVPTTAGCPAYAYTPPESATVVQRLMAAGAVPIGKTNLDQFATGLVGTRSPYGACSSVFDRRYISGGSSSGSAVAVAAGMTSFSLGTDTAGSGRVPASFNGLVGLKPTRGALSTKGVVPACRTLDCVSIFANDAATTARVFSAARGFDPADAYSRAAGQRRSWPASGFRFGVPPASEREFFGDESAPELFNAAIQRFKEQGGIVVEISYRLFKEAAQLLYAGPWVAERLAAIRAFATRHPDALHPVTASIILKSETLKAVDAFAAMYRLAELTREAEALWRQMDFLLLPTAGAACTHEQVAADPIGLNTNLGYYTNFVNLMDLTAIAVPAGIRSNGIPFGVSLIAPAWSDEALLATAMRVQPCCPDGYVPLAVCGAHLSGQPLNHQLISAGAFLLESCRTSPEYKLYALAGTTPAKPGLERVPEGGSAIEVEVWAVPAATFGGFVAAVPPPLAIGTCRLHNGCEVKGFICEPWALAAAKDITALGSWRKYVESN